MSESSIWWNTQAISDTARRAQLASAEAIRNTPAATDRARKAGRAHGTSPYVVAEILMLRKQGATLKALAEKFGLSVSGISRICNRQRRK